MRALLAGLWLERSGRFLWKRRWHAVDAERAALVDFDHDVSAVPLPPLFRGAVPLEAIRSVETSGDDWPHANPVAPGCNPMRPGSRGWARSRVCPCNAPCNHAPSPLQVAKDLPSDAEICRRAATAEHWRSYKAGLVTGVIDTKRARRWS